jgi:hypothetical protein
MDVRSSQTNGLFEPLLSNAPIYAMLLMSTDVLLMSI